jgi:hypothetical protein
MARFMAIDWKLKSNRSEAIEIFMSMKSDKISRLSNAAVASTRQLVFEIPTGAAGSAHYEDLAA